MRRRAHRVVSVLAAMGLGAFASPSLAQDPAGEAFTAEAPIVAGNAATAKQRAMDEAFRQAVERSFVALLAEAGLHGPESQSAPLTQARRVLQSQPRRYIRSYRVLEQGETGGRFRVQIVAEVDDGLVRREIDRARSAAAVAAPKPITVTSRIVVVTGAPTEAAIVLTRALEGAGLKADAPPVGVIDEAKAREIAAQRGGATALLLSGEVTFEGRVRGTARVSAACRLGARLFPPSGPTPPPKGVEARAFSDGEDAARGECLARASGDLARLVAEALVPAAGTAAGMRLVTLELDVVEPAALTLVLQALKKVGSVSGVEVRRIVVGHVEIAVTTRLAAPALATALARELAGTATATVGQALADRVAVEVRLVGPVPEPEPLPAPAPAPPP